MATIFVDVDATGINNGSSWDNAFTDLQSALAIAGASDEIWVAEGTYFPTTDGDQEVSFVINNGVQVYGGFEGNELFLDQRDFEENVTILSGNIGEPSGQNDNSFHVVDITDSVGSTLIDGFTITEGQANGGSSRQDLGGGIYGRRNASATLSNLIITNNFASDDGGGIYLEDDNSPIIINTTFINNLASDNGGAIYIDRNNSLNVLNSLFVNNQSSGGGAIHTRFITTLNVVNSTFYNNQGGDSDAIFDDSSSSTSSLTLNRNISNNIFTNDAAIDRTQIFLDDLNDENTVISNNIIQGGSPLPGDRDVIGEGNITDDPLFVDPDNNDFRLQISSPGIDGGNNDFINLETDIVGNNRIFNNIVDVGAYEYGRFISIDDATIEEGDEGATNLEFTVNLIDSLDLLIPEEIVVSYSIVEDTAVLNSDYTAVTKDNLFFAPGETTQTITIPVVADEIIEGNETLFVQLNDVVGNASIVDGEAVGIIQDDDINQTVELFRFRNTNFDSGTYLFATAGERDNILNKLYPIFPILMRD